MITQSRLIELFDYQDGRLVRKVKCGRMPAGSIAGYKAQNGYVIVRVDNAYHLLHRLIFLMHKGVLPSNIDHINRNPSDNRIENLREATLTQNQGNRKQDHRNKSGFRGVVWNKRRAKWQAQIGINGKSKYLGIFDTAEEAYLKYCQEAEKHFDGYANLK